MSLRTTSGDPDPVKYTHTCTVLSRNVNIQTTLIDMEVNDNDNYQIWAQQLLGEGWGAEQRDEMEGAGL
jgi:hypothetical protein